MHVNPNSGALGTTPQGVKNYSASNPEYTQPQTFCDSQTTRYFQTGSIDPSYAFTSQFSINNVDIGYSQDLASIWSDVRDEFNLGRSTTTGMNPNLLNLQQFAGAYFVHPLRLNMKQSEVEQDNVRALSGLDTRQSTTTCIWKSAGVSIPNINCTPQLWIGTTAILRCGAGRSLDIVS
jgi:hypothetical protein